MRNENSLQNTNTHEAAEGHPPAASASEIINQENPMSKMWPFVGGVIIGAAGIIAAALVADRLAYGAGGGADLKDNPSFLALPDGKDSSE